MLDEIREKIEKSEYFCDAPDPNGKATPEQKFFAILNCRFKDDSNIRNWERYIDDFYKQNWQRLSEETRLVMFEAATKLAHWEDWD